MDDDFQNAPSEALKLAEYSLQNDYDVVFTKYGEKKDSFIRNIMSKIANVTAELILKHERSLEATEKYCMPIKEILTLIPGGKEL